MSSLQLCNHILYNLCVSWTSWNCFSCIFPNESFSVQWKPYVCMFSTLTWALHTSQPRHDCETVHLDRRCFNGCKDMQKLYLAHRPTCSHVEGMFLQLTFQTDFLVQFLEQLTPPQTHTQTHKYTLYIHIWTCIPIDIELSLRFIWVPLPENSFSSQRVICPRLRSI